jgi:hypothetical protein
MIKLTNYYRKNAPLWINKSMIQSIEIYSDVLPSQTYTNIMMRSGQTYSVLETPEQILSLDSVLKG